jgi:hypothetical protein
METFRQRLKRYVDEPATETLGWMRVMLQNTHVVELRRARENKLYHCVYLLAHSIIQTVSEAMFGLTGLNGTHHFLEHFADGATEDLRFSMVSSEIHDVRNIIAHRGYSKTQHEVEYFVDDISQGWRREPDGSLTVNPALYGIQVEQVFLHPTLDLTFREQPALKLLQLKYRFVRQWLDLGKDDTIAKAIKALDGINASDDLERKDGEIRAMICQIYRL